MEVTRLNWGKIKSGAWAEFEAAYKEAIARGPTIDGLRGRWLLRDLSDPSTGFAISIWEDEAKMEAYEKSAFFENVLVPALQPFFTGEFQTSHCEVRSEEAFGD